LIQQLELTSQHSEDHEDLRSLDFPQLTTLKVRISYSKGSLFPTQCLRCYLAPTLTGIELGCVADPTLLGALTKHCPWLRRVELNLRAARLAADPDAVLHYLQTSPSLVHISLTGHNDITPQILHALATKPGLKQLDIKMPLNPDIVDAAGLVSAPDPFAFPALESLVLGAEVGIRVLSKLLPYVRSMKHLCVGLPRSLKAVPMTMPVEANPGATNTTFTFTLQDLSTHLPNLRTLNLKFHTRTEIHLPELLSLALFTELEELHLTSSLPYFRIPKITDTHFTSLVSRLRHLRELSLYCAQESLTTESLIALGQSCRSLVFCTIKCLPLDLSALEDRTGTTSASDRPLFPELTDLSVHHLLLPNSPGNYPYSSRHQIETYLDIPKEEDGEEDMLPDPNDEPGQSYDSEIELKPDPVVIAIQVSILTMHFPKMAYLEFWPAADVHWEFTEAVKTAWMEEKGRRVERMRLARIRQMEYETVRPV
jgi:hypothetical protein